VALRRRQNLSLHVDRLKLTDQLTQRVDRPLAAPIARALTESTLPAVLVRAASAAAGIVELCLQKKNVFFSGV
jgi:hypothetical protein